MSVQKYRICKGESFTSIPNRVLQNLPNYEALGLFAYLLSLPEGWIFHKKHLAEHAKIGRDKINRLLKILHTHALIDYVQTRDEKGAFAHLDLHVKDGRDFKINNLEEPVQPFTEKPLTDTQLLDNSTYKRNINKINKNNKINISCASESDARAIDYFDDFWKSYPVKKNKKRSKQIWDKKKYNDIAQLILSDIDKRKRLDNQWQDIQYIPHASTYLNGELWQDEIIPQTVKPKVNQKHNEIRSTVKEFGPGHPTWEAQQEWRRKNENSHGSETRGSHTAGNGVRQAKDYLF